jgi:hypothetical protein
MVFDPGHFQNRKKAHAIQRPGTNPSLLCPVMTGCFLYPAKQLASDQVHEA